MNLLRRVMPLALFAVIASQAHAQVSDDSPRWTVQIADDPSREPKKTECHPIEYFQNNLKQLDPDAFQTIADDQSSVQQIGAINGFAIYDVIHHFEETAGPAISDGAKMILVQRMAGDFCEIYVEDQETSDVVTIEPPYIDTIGSEKVLVSRDPVGGNAGIISQAYWTFDQMGPIPIDFFSLITTTIRNEIPGGTDAYSSFAFRIHDMIYDNEVWKEGDSHVGPTGGHITIKFAFRDHRPVIVDTENEPSRTQ
jgi:hypothetical protein